MELLITYLTSQSIFSDFGLYNPIQFMISDTDYIEISIRQWAISSHNNQFHSVIYWQTNDLNINTIQMITQSDNQLINNIAKICMKYSNVPYIIFHTTHPLIINRLKELGWCQHPFTPTCYIFLRLYDTG